MNQLAKTLVTLFLLAALGGAARAEIQINADGVQLVQTSGVEAWMASTQTTPSQVMLEGVWGVIRDSQTEGFTAVIAPNQLDLARPTGSFTINNGAATAKNATVLLRITASDDIPWGWGVARVRLSNDGTTWSDWLPFVRSITYTLPMPNGFKTVLLQLCDGAGNLSPVVKQSITLNVPRNAVDGSWSFYE